MILNLYKTLDADNVINKTLLNKLTIQGFFLTSSLNIVNPVIPLQVINGIDIYEYNYIELPDFNRFYFVDSIENVNAKIFNLICSCDVLMTYKEAILNSNARVMRSLKTGDYYNGESLVNVKPTITTHLSNIVLDDTPSLILTTVGNK